MDNQPTAKVMSVCDDEPLVLSNADVIVVTTEADRARMHTSYTAAAARSLTIPMVPMPSCPQDSRLPNRTGLLYLGGNHRTNIRSFVWFLTEVLPKIRERIPGSCTFSPLSCSPGPPGVGGGIHSPQPSLAFDPAQLPRSSAPKARLLVGRLQWAPSGLLLPTTPQEAGAEGAGKVFDEPPAPHHYPLHHIYVSRIGGGEHPPNVTVQYL